MPNLRSNVKPIEPKIEPAVKEPKKKSSKKHKSITVQNEIVSNDITLLNERMDKIESNFKRIENKLSTINTTPLQPATKQEIDIDEFTNWIMKLDAKSISTSSSLIKLIQPKNKGGHSMKYLIGQFLHLQKLYSEAHK